MVALFLYHGHILVVHHSPRSTPQKDIGGHPRFEHAILIGQPDVDGEDQVDPFLLGGYIARGELRAAGNVHDFAFEDPSGKAVHLDLYGSAQVDLADAVLGT